MMVSENSFKWWKFLYSNQYYLCDSMGYLYDREFNLLSDIHCMKWRCKRCRYYKKFFLYLDVLANVYAFNLDKHFILTFGGKEMRDIFSWEESYKIMSKKWHSFMNCIKKFYGNFDYILFPRAQKSGYCHYHVITNTYLDWDWLNKKRKLYGLGFMSIQKNNSVADYLALDYFKDHEWVIPPDFKHYRCSRSIVLNNFMKRKNCFHHFDYDYSLDKIKKSVDMLYENKLDLDDYYIDKLVSNIKSCKKVIYR